VALVGRDELADEEPPVVGGPVGGAPAAALNLQEQAVGVGPRRVDDVDVGVLAVAPGRGVGEPLAAVRPHRAGVARLAVGEQRHVAGGEVVAVVLEKLVAAGVAVEDEVVAGRGPVRGAAGALGEEGELRARAARRLHEVYLIGVAEARADEHLAPGGVPVRERGRAELRVAAHVLGERRRNRGDALDDEVVAGDDDGRALRQRRRDEQQQGGQEARRSFHWADSFSAGRTEEKPEAEIYQETVANRQSSAAGREDKSSAAAARMTQAAAALRFLPVHD
jgi:hypothetical protein